MKGWTFYSRYPYMFNVYRILNPNPPTFFKLISATFCKFLKMGGFPVVNMVVSILSHGLILDDLGYPHDFGNLYSMVLWLYNSSNHGVLWFMMVDISTVYIYISHGGLKDILKESSRPLVISHPQPLSLAPSQSLPPPAMPRAGPAAAGPRLPTPRPAARSAPRSCCCVSAKS